jgi:hypothetical protein
MGIYYFAVDYSKKEQMWAPGKFSDKCIYHPHHPLPQMIAMKNCDGSNFEIVNDMSTFEEHEFKDVTDEVFTELKETFPDFDWKSYESS